MYMYVDIAVYYKIPFGESTNVQPHLRALCLFIYFANG